MLERPDPGQRQHPKPSGRAKLDLAWERFGVIAKQLPPLLKRHWRELASFQSAVPLDMDWERYFDADLGGFLHCLTVRADSVLVGYAFFFVHSHLHYVSTVWATLDGVWIEPEFRGGTTFLRMIDESERYLKRLGVKVVQLNRKISFDDRLGKLFERKGYHPDEMIYAKVLSNG